MIVAIKGSIPTISVTSATCDSMLCRLYEVKDDGATRTLLQNTTLLSNRSPECIAPHLALRCIVSVRVVLRLGTWAQARSSELPPRSARQEKKGPQTFARILALDHLYFVILLHFTRQCYSHSEAQDNLIYVCHRQRQSMRLAESPLCRPPVMAKQESQLCTLTRLCMIRVIFEHGRENRVQMYPSQ